MGIVTPHRISRPAPAALARPPRTRRTSPEAGRERRAPPRADNRRRDVRPAARLDAADLVQVSAAGAHVPGRLVAAPVPVEELPGRLHVAAVLPVLPERVRVRGRDDRGRVHFQQPGRLRLLPAPLARPERPLLHDADDPAAAVRLHPDTALHPVQAPRLDRLVPAAGGAHVLRQFGLQHIPAPPVLHDDTDIIVGCRAGGRGERVLHLRPGSSCRWPTRPWPR